MGNSASSAGRGHGDESVDGGHLFPQGVYTGQRDWNHSIVTQLIIERRLAPFYRPLEDYDASWDDDQILAARKELPVDPDAPPHELGGQAAGGTTGSGAAASSNSSLSSRSGSHLHLHSKKSSQKEVVKPSEAFVYRGAVECPICFLYYPPNINRSRCCDQAVCTECFVQIKRAEPTTTHLVSEPAACPYCVQENFGVVYTPPPWRTGIGADRSHNSHSLVGNNSPRGSQFNVEQSTATPTPPGHKRRQKSFSADSPEVVTTDQIRPDWEAKLAAVRAAVTRRANRRIIMRRVGDQLIPVGVTSGRLPPPGEGSNNGPGGGESGGGGGVSIFPNRPSRRGQLEQLLAPMGMGGQDLEELMVMEAMRLSLLEHEEQQRKEEAAKKKKEAEEAAAAAAGHASSPGAGPSSQSQQHAETSSSPLPPPPPTRVVSAEAPDAPASNTSLSTQPLSLSPPSETGTAQQYGTLGALVGSASSAAAAIGSPASHSPHPSSATSDEHSPVDEPTHSLEPSSSSSSAPVVSSSPDSTEPSGTGIDHTATTPRLSSNDSYTSTTTVSTTATGQSSQAYSVLPSDTDTEPADDEPLIAHVDFSSSAPTEPHSSQ